MSSDDAGFPTVRFRKLVIASGNAGKLREFANLLAPLGVQLHAQSEFDVRDADEPYGTFIENALTKARHASQTLPHISFQSQPVRTGTVGREDAICPFPREIVVERVFVTLRNCLSALNQSRQPTIIDTKQHTRGRLRANDLLAKVRGQITCLSLRSVRNAYQNNVERRTIFYRQKPGWRGKIRRIEQRVPVCVERQFALSDCPLNQGVRVRGRE